METYKHLEVGQTVWLEQWSIYQESFRNLDEYKVVESNAVVAYIIPVESQEMNDRNKVYIYQDLRTVYRPHSFAFYYRVWNTKEEYEAFLKLAEEYKNYRAIANEKINSMTLERLKEFAKEDIHEEE